MTEPAIQKLSMAVQITKLKTRFGLTRVALVGDRGMLASARIRDELRPAALDWISALRAPHITALVETDALQLSLFDEQDLVQITHPDYPGERLVCCRASPDPVLTTTANPPPAPNAPTPSQRPNVQTPR